MFHKDPINEKLLPPGLNCIEELEVFVLSCCVNSSGFTAFFPFQLDKADADRLAKWKKEREAREKLMKDVLRSREQQIEEKRKEQKYTLPSPFKFGRRQT